VGIVQVSMELWLNKVCDRSRDIVLCSGRGLNVCKEKDLYFLRVRCLLLRAHSTSTRVHKSSPSQVPMVLLTAALIVLWLLLQEGDPYTNHLLKDVAIFLCID